MAFAIAAVIASILVAGMLGGREVRRERRERTTSMELLACWEGGSGSRNIQNGCGARTFDAFIDFLHV